MRSELIGFDGASAIRYLPTGFKPYRSYPLLMALHGMKQTNQEVFEIWRPVADAIGMILICPQGSNFKLGYTRQSPRDDRKVLVGFKKMMREQFYLEEDRSVLIGFSRGGNIATELGVMYPEIFPQVVSLFGFFTSALGLSAPGLLSRAEARSSFYFVTGTGDLTYGSSVRGAQVLKGLGARTYLKVFDGLKHGYPGDLRGFLDGALDWFLRGK